MKTCVLFVCNEIHSHTTEHFSHFHKHVQQRPPILIILMSCSLRILRHSSTLTELLYVVKYKYVFLRCTQQKNYFKRPFNDFAKRETLSHQYNIVQKDVINVMLGTTVHGLRLVYVRLLIYT